MDEFEVAYEEPEIDGAAGALASPTGRPTTARFGPAHGRVPTGIT